MIFGIDYDGTFSRDPEAFRGVVLYLRCHGHSCVLVTGRTDAGVFGREVRQSIGDLMPILFTDGAPKRKFVETMGYRIDVWIDDMPETIV